MSQAVRGQFGQIALGTPFVSTANVGLYRKVGATTARRLGKEGEPRPVEFSPADPVVLAFAPGEREMPLADHRFGDVSIGSRIRFGNGPFIWTKISETEARTWHPSGADTVNVGPDVRVRICFYGQSASSEE